MDLGWPRSSKMGWTVPRKSALQFIWWALLAGLVAHGATLAAYGHGLDFGIYLQAAQRFLLGEELYPLADGPWIFKYAPAAAWLFTPFAALPPRLANALWNVGGVASLWLSARAVGRHAAPTIWPSARIAALLALTQPLLLEMRYGQADLVLLALLVFSIELAEKRPAIAGLLAAVALLLKPPALIVLALFAARRHFRALGAAGAATLLLWLPVVLRFGLAGTRAAHLARGVVVAHLRWRCTSLSALLARQPGSGVAAGGSCLRGPRWVDRRGTPLRRERARQPISAGAGSSW